jgi:hypothetical protein
MLKLALKIYSSTYVGIVYAIDMIKLAEFSFLVLVLLYHYQNTCSLGRKKNGSKSD